MNKLEKKFLEIILPVQKSEVWAKQAASQCASITQSLIDSAVETSLRKTEFKKFDDGLAGDVAKKYKCVVGEIGCPHCGSTRHGYLESTCMMCEKPYFEIAEKEMCVSCDKEKELHHICMDCIQDMIKENQTPSQEAGLSEMSLADLIALHRFTIITLNTHSIKSIEKEISNRISKINFDK